MMRRLLVITTRFNFVTLEVPADDKGAQLPTEDQVNVVKECCLFDLLKCVVSPQMLQFVGLIWKENHELPPPIHDLIVFESSSQRNTFRSIVSQIPEPNLGKGRVVKRDMIVHPHLTEAIHGLCKTERGEATLVSIVFIRELDKITGIQCLVMCVETIQIFSALDVLRLIARSEDFHYYERDVEDQPTNTNDSDTDDDALLKPQVTSVNADLTTADSIEKFTKKNLKGVWFLKDQEPKIMLMFKDSSTLTFFSDGDRQRFRRHFSIVLEMVDPEVAAKSKESAHWLAASTRYKQLKEATKEVEEILS